jgi:hypothetical protein
LNELRDPVEFWTKFEGLRSATGPIPRKPLQAMLPSPKLPYRVVRRVAGVGSLGRPRFVAIAEWGGGLVAREAKAVVPSALAWVKHRNPRTNPAVDLLKRAVRVRDPFYDVQLDWILRRLAPDCSRIELSELPDRRDEWRLLRTMGWETANVHLGTRRAGIRADLTRRPGGWLVEAAMKMADAVRKDWRQWIRG